MGVIDLTSGIKPPCMKCKKRKLNCHSTCKSYKEYQDKLSKRKKDYSGSLGWNYTRSDRR